MKEPLSQIPLQEFELYSNLKARMRQRGISLQEVQEVLKLGWAAKDAKEGTSGKTKIFVYRQEWEGQWFEEKEVTVYYKYIQQQMVLLTVKARYGKGFPKEDL